jgi:Na+/proline symporter
VNPVAYIAVFSAILLPAILYFSVAYRERKNVLNIRDFFPLKRSISTGEYRSTTVAAGMSLATVIIAFINLAPALGITLFVSVITYSLSFVLLYFCADRIMKANPQNDTIQAYLGKSYRSSNVKNIALIFSLIGYVSIFSMELLVGVTILEPFLGAGTMIFALVYLVFIIVYTLMSGYRAVIATDKWQLRFILVSLASLLVLAIVETQQAPAVDVLSTFSSVTTSWVPAWAFIIGIAVINLPSPISDAGTWQRLCSTKDSQSAKRGLIQISRFFAILWAFIVIFACYYWRVAAATGFDPTQETLMTHIMRTFATSGPIFIVLLFLFVLGLFSAMISTADSLLIVVGQFFSIDILKLDPEDANPQRVMQKARFSTAVIAVVSFVIFAILRFLQFDVVQLVFAIYGAQLAMFPSVFFSLFFSNRFNLRKARYAASSSIFTGFLGGWASALYGRFSGASNWLFNAPATALVVSFIVFVLLASPTLLAPNKEE